MTNNTKQLIEQAAEKTFRISIGTVSNYQKQDGFIAGANYVLSNPEILAASGLVKKEEQPTGMRWVKASERLPDNQNLVHIKYGTIKTDMATTGFYCLNDKSWRRTDGSVLSFQDRVEWLDEQAPAEGWVSVKNRPLINKTEGGNILTDAGAAEFLAAVPYVDANRPGQSLWWIRHCVIDNGLCVVGDSDNEAAGWEVEDITHYIPIPQPPKAE